MPGFWLRLLISAAGLWLASELLGGVTIRGTGSFIIAAVLLGLINGTVRPVLFLLTLPLTIVTLGIFILVLNGLMFALVAAVLPGFQVAGLGSSILGAIIVSLTSIVASWFIGPDGRYEVLVVDAEDNTESVGLTTANPGGNASFKVDNESGDPLPFGVADLDDLVGLTIVVVDAEGNTAVTGVVCEPQVVDEGEKPAVISALLKYRSTELMRRAVNDALDIHGGRGICDGPTNYIQSGYQMVPVAITVEGANILTRSLIAFAQGALRCHPWLYAEIQALQDEDEERGLAAFETAFRGHVASGVANVFGAP